MSEELIEELARPIIGIENRTAQEVFDMMSDRIRFGLPRFIRRLQLEAGEKVRDAAATVKPTNTPASECETTGQWTRRTLREAIRALDVAAIIGASHD